MPGGYFSHSERVSLGLQVVAFQAGPPLQGIMVPGPAGQVFVAVVVAVGEDVQAGPLLVADHHGQRVLELLAEADVQHAGIQRLAPHADVEPARAGPGTGDRAGQHHIAVTVNMASLR